MINLRIHTSVLSYYIFLTFNILSVQPDIKLQSAGSCSSPAHTCQQMLCPPAKL